MMDANATYRAGLVVVGLHLFDGHEHRGTGVRFRGGSAEEQEAASMDFRLSVRLADHGTIPISVGGRAARRVDVVVQALAGFPEHAPRRQHGAINPDAGLVPGHPDLVSRAELQVLLRAGLAGSPPEDPRRVAPRLPNHGQTVRPAGRPRASAHRRAPRGRPGGPPGCGARTCRGTVLRRRWSRSVWNSKSGCRKMSTLSHGPSGTSGRPRGPKRGSGWADVLPEAVAVEEVGGVERHTDGGGQLSLGSGPRGAARSPRIPARRPGASPPAWRIRSRSVIPSCQSNRPRVVHGADDDRRPHGRASPGGRK